MTEAKNNLQSVTKAATAPTTLDFPEGTTFDNAHTANSLVARMLWGHEEKKVSLNVRVSEDGTLDLNDIVH